MSQQATFTQQQPASVTALVQRLTAFEGAPAAFLRELLATQCALAQVESAAMLRLDAERAHVVASWPALEADGPPPVWLAKAAEQVARAERFDAPALLPLDDGDGLYGETARQNVILLPIREQEQLRGVVAFLSQATSAGQLQHQRERLELSMILLSLYEMRLTLERNQRDLQSLATAVETLASTNEQERFKAAAMGLCNEIATRWNAERVSFGLLRGRYVKLQAMNQTEHINRKMQLVQDVEAAMEECLDQDVEVIHPAPQEAAFVSRAAAELAQRHGPSTVLSLPLRHEGGVVGVLTLERPADDPFTLQDVEFLRLAADLCTARLVELAETDRFFAVRWTNRTRKVLGTVLGPKHTWAKLTAIALLAFVLFAVFVEGTYRVSGSFVLAPVEQRLVPSPFEGYLSEAMVEPGDAVEAGAVLARMDTAELELERARAQAEYFSYLKEADRAMDPRVDSPVDKQIAEAKAAEAQARLKWIDYRIERAVITSPIAGTVVQGDLKPRLGSPLSKGDVLFRIAPQDQFRAELRVEDKDIATVLRHHSETDPLTGSLATAANPGEYLPFTVTYIHPVAEMVDQRNVFTVRATLDEQPQDIRSGAEGVAKIDIDKRPYIAIWTRDAVNWVRMKLWF